MNLDYMNLMTYIDSINLYDNRNDMYNNYHYGNYDY